MTSTIVFHLIAVGVGAVFAVLYLGLLWRAVGALTRKGGGGQFVFLVLLRSVLLVAALAGGLAVGAGASQIGAALLGFLLIRFAVTHMFRTGKVRDTH
jgi:hypothetical protein